MNHYSPALLSGFTVRLGEPGEQPAVFVDVHLTLLQQVGKSPRQAGGVNHGAAQAILPVLVLKASCTSQPQPRVAATISFQLQAGDAEGRIPAIPIVWHVIEVHLEILL